VKVRFPLPPVVRPDFGNKAPRVRGASSPFGTIKKLLLFAATASCAGVSSLHSQTATTATPVPMAVPPPVAPLRPLPAPPLRPIVQPLAHPDIAEIQRFTPRVEVWRPNGDRPQVPMRRGKRTDYALTTGTEPVTVRLQFHPRLAGQRVVVIAPNGFLLNPPQEVVTISARGECVLTGQLAEGAATGHFVAYCGLIHTVVPFARASPAKVQAEELRTGGRP
jgi:hypothetical protein